jgi:lipoprotein signal peptidase
MLFWLPLLPLIVLDVRSKSAVFEFLLEKAGGVFDITMSQAVFSTAWVDFDLVNFLNRGTVWGLGEEFHEGLKFLRVGAIAVILYFLYRTPASQRAMVCALGLIMAGAVGNLHDNFFNDMPRYEGAVRDFIHFHNPGSWDFPAFNVADSCITVGAVTLFLCLWFTPTESGREGTESPKDAS